MRQAWEPARPEKPGSLFSAAGDPPGTAFSRVRLQDLVMRSDPRHVLLPYSGDPSPTLATEGLDLTKDASSPRLTLGAMRGGGSTFSQNSSSGP